MTQFKTSPQDAAAIVQQMYALVPSVVPTAKDTAWWVKQVQQDGSHTAFLNFGNGIAKDHGPQVAQQLTQATAAFTKANGYAPWQPNAQTPQLPGTNTKSGGAIIGTALTSPVGKALEAAAAGVLDVITGGAATPFTTAGLAALQGGGTALQPGENIGGIAKSALGGAATGAAVGAGAGLLNKALPGIASVGNVGSGIQANGGPSSVGADFAGDPGGSAQPDVPNVDPAGTPAFGGGGTNSLPGVAGVAKTAATAAGHNNPLSTAGGNILNSNLGQNVLAAGLLGTAAVRGSQSTDYAKGALKTAQDWWDQRAGQRAAGIAGTANPTAADQSSLTAIRSSNPFSRIAPVAGAPPAAPPSPAPALPTGPTPIKVQPVPATPPIQGYV